MQRFLFSAATATLLSFASLPAVAADPTLTVEQASASSRLGTWLLVMPNGTLVENHRGDRIQIVQSAHPGIYTINVDPPSNAITTITLLDESRRIVEQVEDRRLSFTLTGASMTIELGYRFLGSVKVQSIPSGQEFSMTGSDGSVREGTTPEDYIGIPAVTYRVIYGSHPRCVPPRAQERSLGATESIIFVGRYSCDNALPTPPTPPAPPAPPRPPVSPVSQESELRMQLTGSQTEVMPGETFTVDLNLHNIGRSTLRNVAATLFFDAAMVSPVFPIPSGAIQTQPNSIVWLIPFLDAGQSFSTPITMKALDNLSAGTQTVISAGGSADNLSSAGTNVRDTNDRITVGGVVLPATGWNAAGAMAALWGLAALLFALTISVKRRVV
jgi:hypothetical protein